MVDVRVQEVTCQFLNGPVASATCTIQYGTDETNLNLTNTNSSTNVNSVTVMLSEPLQPDTRYYYVVSSMGVRMQGTFRTGMVICDGIGIYTLSYVAVPGRNRTLFRCILRTYYCVQSAVTQCFHYRWGSYTLCKLMNTWHVYTVRMGPTCNGSTALQRFVRGNVLEICNGIMFNSYPGLPHM